jgi:hypothetical protein
MKSLPASDFTAAISAQFARVSPRERRLLAVLALAAIVAAPIKALDLYQQAQSRNLAARDQLSQALLAARSLRSGGVGGQLARQREEIKAWSWTAPSAAVGRVIAQDRIAAIATAAGMADAEIKAAEKIERAGGVELVKVDIDAPFTWANLSALLSGLSATGKGFVVDSLTIQDAPKPRLKMGLKLPMTTGAPQTPAA